MKNKYNKGIATLAAIVILAIAGLISGYLGSKADHKVNTSTGGTYVTPDVRALFETSLASKVTSSATTFTLTSATDKDGTTLASSTYGFIIDEGKSTEEFVLADCTATACTNATRGLSARTGTSSVTALKFEHPRGASVKITDAPSLLFTVNVLEGRQNLEMPLLYGSTTYGYATTSEQITSARWQNALAGIASTSAYKVLLGANNLFLASSSFNKVINIPYDTASTSAASVGYVNAISIAGASDANQTTKGIVEEATVAEINSGTKAGGTGADLYVNPAQLQYSTYASSTVQIYFATTTSGRVMTKSLNMTAGQAASLIAQVNAGTTNVGTLKFRISSPWAGSTTTVMSEASFSDNTMGGAVYTFLATTTETVHFEFAPGASSAGFVIILSPNAFANTF